MEVQIEILVTGCVWGDSMYLRMVEHDPTPFVDRLQFILTPFADIIIDIQY